MTTFNEFEISMPHRHTIIYTDHKGSASFEIEPAIDGLIFYYNSGVNMDDGKVEIKLATSRVYSWLNVNFKNDGFKVHKDDRPPSGKWTVS